MSKTRTQKKKSHRKKLFLILGISILLMGLCVGYWMYRYQSITTYTVTGSAGAPLSVLFDFSDQIMDVSTTFNMTQDLSLHNADGQANMTLSKIVIFEPSDLGCIDQDLEILFYNYLDSYETGDTFLINGEGSVFHLQASIPEEISTRACEGIYSVELEFIQTP